MNFDIQALREKRNTLVASFENVLSDNKESWGAEADEKVSSINAEIDAIDSQIRAHDSFLARKAEASAETDLREQLTRTPSAHVNPDGNQALRAYLTGGIAALSDDQRRELGARQTGDIRAAMSTTTNSEGGYTTAPEYSTELLEAMKAYGGMRQAARVIRTANGNQMLWSTADATAETGAIVGQNSTVSAVDTTFGQISLDVFKYTSNSIALPFELLQDTFLDLEAYIRGLLATRLARVQNAHFTTGTGTGQPTGVVTAAAEGVVGSTGKTTTVAYDDLVSLEHSLDPAYRAGSSWMMNDASIATLRKLKDGSQRPLFVPGYETGVPGGAMGTLLGRPIIVNQDMAVMAADAKSILYGNFDNYIIRDVMDLTLFRMTDSAYTLKGQVGFVAFMRSGGNLASAASPIKYYQNSAT